MSDLPVLFSTPMVLALLSGSKAQTRLILKPQPYNNGFHFDGRDILCHCDELPPSALLMDKGKGKNRYTVSNFEDGPEGFAGVYVGDHLWVRESGQLLREAYEHEPGVGDLWRDAGFYHSADGEIIAARGYDTPIREWIDDCAKISRPSIHMPRWASRLTLTVTDVRVQRLQDISEEDAIAEGAYRGKASGRFADNYAAMTLGEWHATARGWYANLWDRINGAGSWAENPWVAAYTFDVEARNIDAPSPPPRGGLAVSERGIREQRQAQVDRRVTELRSVAAKKSAEAGRLSGSANQDSAFWTQPVYCNAAGRAFARSRERERAKLIKAGQAAAEAKELTSRADALEARGAVVAGDAQHKREEAIASCTVKVGDLVDTTLYGVRRVVRVNRKTVAVEGSFGPLTVCKSFVSPAPEGAR